MAKKNAITTSSTPTVLARATEASEIKIDIERIAQEAESACEFDRHGGPPVLLVNWAGAAVITSTFERGVFWRGVALRHDNAHNLLAHLLRLHRRYASARGNLLELINSVIDVLVAGCDGLAIVDTGSDPLSCTSAELKRAKCEERGHLIQYRLEREASTSELGWYEDLYNRPAAQLFVGALRRRGCTLYDTDNKILIVNEFAMKINYGEWRFYDIAVHEAKVWLAAYFREVRRNLGREILIMFRSILIGRVAKTAFREALACEEAGIPS